MLVLLKALFQNHKIVGCFRNEGRTTKCCEIQSLVNHDNVIKCLEMRRRRHHWISLFNLALNLQQDT